MTLIMTLCIAISGLCAPTSKYLWAWPTENTHEYDILASYRRGHVCDHFLPRHKNNKIVKLFGHELPKTTTFCCRDSLITKRSIILFKLEFVEISGKFILLSLHFQNSDLNLAFEARSHILDFARFWERDTDWLLPRAESSELVSKPEDSPLRFSLLCTPESSALLDRFIQHVCVPRKMALPVLVQRTTLIFYGGIGWSLKLYLAIVQN